MLPPDGRHADDQVINSQGTLFGLLGGDLAAVDLWTRVDFTWMHHGVADARDSVGYRGLSAAYRVAGLTIGDTDADPMCPPFLIEISADRLRAQVVWSGEAGQLSRMAAVDLGELHHWSAGSLTKHLRVVRFEDGDVGLEADFHLAATVDPASVREFVTAFSWDVAALHVCATAGTLETTEEWVRRAALSISRSTPPIPLREHPTPEWHAIESPRGVFCSLQPGGGLCTSDNVLYAVRREASMLTARATMPGHRSDWDYARITDVWLARDSGTAFARTLLCEGLASTTDGRWHAVATPPVTAVATWGDDGFALGLHDGQLVTIDGAQRVSAKMRIAKVTGRFSRLVTHAEKVIGLVGSTLFGARVIRSSEGAHTVTEPWLMRLGTTMAFSHVAEIDVDRFSSTPSVAVLGDDGIAIIDAVRGTVKARYATPLAQQVKWIGPGWLMVLDACYADGTDRTRIRVLDIVSGRWTEPVVTAEITRIAVRGDDIQVGYSDLTIAVWDRLEVCRGIGTSAFTISSPDAPQPESRQPQVPAKGQGIARS